MQGYHHPKLLKGKIGSQKFASLGNLASPLFLAQLPSQPSPLNSPSWLCWKTDLSFCIRRVGCSQLPEGGKKVLARFMFGTVAPLN